MIHINNISNSPRKLFPVWNVFLITALSELNAATISLQIKQ